MQVTHFKYFKWAHPHCSFVCLLFLLFVPSKINKHKVGDLKQIHSAIVPEAEVWYKDVSKTSPPSENPGKIPFLDPRQLLLIPDILRLVAPSVPSLCLPAVCSTVCISLCLPLRKSIMVGRALSSNPARSFYFKIINYLSLFMAHAKIFFSPNFVFITQPTIPVVTFVSLFGILPRQEPYKHKLRWFLLWLTVWGHVPSWKERHGGREHGWKASLSHVLEEQGAEKRQKVGWATIWHSVTCFFWWRHIS